jgi:hypothetical protein
MVSTIQYRDNQYRVGVRCKSYARGDVYRGEMDKKNAQLARESGVFLRER